MQDLPEYVLGQDGQLYAIPRNQQNHEVQGDAPGLYTSVHPSQAFADYHNEGYVPRPGEAPYQGNVANRLTGFDAGSAGNSALYAPDVQASQPAFATHNHATYHSQQHPYHHKPDWDTIPHQPGRYEFGHNEFDGVTGYNASHSRGAEEAQHANQSLHPAYFAPALDNVANAHQPPSTITGFTSTMPPQHVSPARQTHPQEAPNLPNQQLLPGPQIQPQVFQYGHQPIKHVAPYSDAMTSERSSTGPGDYSSDGNTNGKKHKKSNSGGDESRHAIAPPVKNACLACRAKKARCDGVQPICGQCVAKDRECQYVKSRRGGARKKKEQLEPAPTPLAQYLKQLDDLAGLKMEMPPDMGDLHLAEGKVVDPALAVRTWHPQDIVGILTAYWEEIHPFQPLLPPVKHLPFIAARLSPDSPFLLAIRAILALCPNPADPVAKSLASRALRRAQAARLAQEASNRVDEMLAEAHEDDATSSIECVQALALLGLYEFAQNGNPVRNRMRMNQAVQVAMEMGLHQTDKANFDSSDPVRPRVTPAKAVEGESVVKDMARRTWWVAFAAMLISGLVAGSRPIVAHDDKRIAVHYPACALDDDSWSNWIESIGLACAAMDVIMTLDFNFPNPDAPESALEEGNFSDEEFQGMTDPAAKAEAQKKKRLHRRMLKLDRTVLELLKKGEAKSVIPLVPGGEEEVVRNQQLSASMMLAVCHIQLHRRQAFPEVAMFSRKMCGLPKAAAGALPPTPQQPLSVSSGSQAFVPNGSSNGNGSPYAGSQMLSSYQDSGSLLAGSGSDNGLRTLGYPLPVTPVQNSAAYTYQHSNAMSLNAQALDQLPMEGLLWDPALYPQSFPAPWFAMPKGAGSLYQPVNEAPAYLPPVPGIFTAETGYIGMPLNGYQADRSQVTAAQATASMQEISPTQAARMQPRFQDQPITRPAPLTAKNPLDPAPTERQPQSEGATKQHKAWGVDIKRAPVQLAVDRTQSGVEAKQDSDSSDSVDDDPVVVGPDGPFPPGVSLQRCATAAHSVVRLEVLHRSATLAMWKGPPKWMPFCACGLVCGAYSFLLLCLAVQASDFTDVSAIAREELEALWTNVKVILAGLQAYGQMWDGIDMMASEVKAALVSATKLSSEIAQSNTATSP
ncbi:hypothetical protein NliqN6_0712 [Naganishia liquefaciens]|uniref:Zn(2)-C6 fungal-type domain-containing protein n=1 Tax=Naganishia liquefaciens TaxID=104408 RepID=A0A8H3YCG8_9TREE|nr:hypothetical protein NliqN6_0712 [Naganishia liquefaciens]